MSLFSVVGPWRRSPAPVRRVDDAGSQPPVVGHEGASRGVVGTASADAPSHSALPRATGGRDTPPVSASRSRERQVLSLCSRPQRERWVWTLDRTCGCETCAAVVS